MYLLPWTLQPALSTNPRIEGGGRAAELGPRRSGRAWNRHPIEPYTHGCTQPGGNLWVKIWN